MKIEEGIDPSISWRPTFLLKPAKYIILAVEVEDLLYPEALKAAAHDIAHFDIPIAVYQACSLESYQADPKQERINLLKKHGFGIITVRDDGHVQVQSKAIPLMQNISPDQFEKLLVGLPSRVKIALRGAFDTYQASEGQGLQQAGQVVEALITALAQHAKKNAVINPTNGASLAGLIDLMYNTQAFQNHRAALGGARDFVRDFRNTASHAPRSAKQLADKIRGCRTGFLDALSITRKLITVMKAEGCTVKVHTGV